MTLSASRGQNAMPMLTDRNTSCWLMWNGGAGGIQHRTRQLQDLRHGASSASPAKPSTNSANSSPARRPSTASLGRTPRQAFGQHFQHAVAGRMAEGVVDLLELVHVDVEQRHAEIAAPRARDRLLQQVLELHAVRNLGQRVVARQVADAPLGALALGDVARHVDLAGKLRVVGGDGRGDEGHRDGLAGARCA